MSWPIAWVDLDTEATRKVSELLKTLEETDIVDPLGIGVVRDSVSDYFFPATSTLMSRARYFFLVPAAFNELERIARRRPAEYAKDSLLRAQLRRIERRQAESLIQRYQREVKEDLNNSGIIGWTIVTKEEGFVAHPPSEIYWSALVDLGMIRTETSSAGFRKSLLLRDKQSVSADEMDGEDIGGQTLWDRNIPPMTIKPSGGLPLDLTQKESVYLRDRYIRSCSGKLIASLLTGGEKLKLSEDIRWPWDLEGLKNSDAKDLLQTKRIAALMQGANLAYNHFLGGLLTQDLRKKAKLDWSRWWDGSDDIGRSDAIRADTAWTTGRTFGNQADLNSARKFLDAFQLRIKSGENPAKVLGGDCFAFLETRELEKKKGSARLRHPAARAGQTELKGRDAPDFRWRTAKRIILDILQGLGG